MKWWRSILLVASLLFIAIATLTPAAMSGGSGTRPDFWCIACGAEGGADVTLNIALFVPLGVALTLLRVSPIRAGLLGLLLSLLIETSQHFGIPPGRVASVSDLLTNATGTLLGAIVAWNHAQWLHPSRRAAVWLSGASIAVVAAFLAFTGWALGRDVDTRVSSGQAALTYSNGAFATGYGWYHGVVTHAIVAGHEYPHTGNGPMVFFGAVGNELNGAVEVFGRDERREFVPLLTVQGNFPGVPEMMLGQQYVDAQLRVRLRGSRMRLPGPSLLLRDVFVNDDSTHFALAFRISPQSWGLKSVRGTVSRTTTLAISLSLGWTLFQTVVHVGDRFAAVVTVCWLLVLWLPVGYWCALAGQSRASAAPLQAAPIGTAPSSTASSSTAPSRAAPVRTAPSGAARLIQRWQFVAAGALSMVLTLTLVPRVMAISATLPMEWILSAAGFATGVFFATRFYNSISTK